MDIGEIEQLVDIIRGARISELAVSSGGARVRLRKELGAAPPKPVQAPKPAAAEPAAGEVAEVAESGSSYITAPMVGIFHNRDGSGLLGSKVRSGQVVGAIESMKLMNDIVSDADGTITEVLVEDGSPVEYGQNLFKVQSAE